MLSFVTEDKPDAFQQSSLSVWAFGFCGYSIPDWLDRVSKKQCQADKGGVTGDISMILKNVVVKERCCPSTRRSSDTRMSLLDLTSWNSHLEFYLYHDVDVLAILQQTQIRIEVEPVVLGAGVSQDHLTVPEGLKEDLLPMCSLIRQQLPLKGRHNERSPS